MGMSMFSSHDELQIYLIGLKSYLNGTYPYFGPDVVYTSTQIPGGLQGLLVAIPLYILGIPEAPYILLNLLSFTTLLFFAWYLSKRINKIPSYYFYFYILICPWAMNYSIHIENPSYVLIGAILFFMALFELGGFYKTYLFSPKISFFFIGFAMLWIFQLHLSWIIMIPYVVWIFWRNRKDLSLFWSGFLYFSLGALFSGSTLIPTILKGYSTGGVENNIVLNLDNLMSIPLIIIRFLLFACFEVSRFIGPDNSSRIEFLQTQIWAAPIIITLFIVGLVQLIYLILSFFKTVELDEWKQVKQFTLLSLVLICFSFLFSISDPASHTFYIFFPLALWYAFYCFHIFFQKNNFWIVNSLLIFGILFQVSLFIDRYNTRSLYTKYAIVEEAIAEKDYSLLYVRRESELDRANRDKVWEKKYDNEFYTGFEVKDNYFKAQNIVQNKVYEGKFSCKIDSIQNFSVDFKTKLLDLGKPSKLNSKFWVKTDNSSDFVFVYVLKDKESNWNAKELSLKDNLDWQFLDLTVDLPSYETDRAELHCYLWMKQKSKSRLYIDNWTLKFMK